MAKTEEKKVVKKTNTKRQTQLKKTKKTKKGFIDNLIPKTTGEKILLASFLILLVIVISLGIKAVTLKKEQNSKKDIDLIMPILDKNTNNTFSVDLSDLQEDGIKEYKFMVTNYKDKKISKSNIKYQLDLTKNSDAVSIKLYKDKGNTDLLNGNVSPYTIKDNLLEKNEEDSDTYYLIIRAKGKTKEKDNITIKVTSIN